MIHIRYGFWKRIKWKNTAKRKKLISIDLLNKRGKLKFIIATTSRRLVLWEKQIIVVGWSATRQTSSYFYQFGRKSIVYYYSDGTILVVVPIDSEMVQKVYRSKSRRWTYCVVFAIWCDIACVCNFRGYNAIYNTYVWLDFWLKFWAVFRAVVVCIVINSKFSLRTIFSRSRCFPCLVTLYSYRPAVHYDVAFSISKT